MSELDRSKEMKTGFATAIIIIALAMLAALTLFAAYDLTPRAPSSALPTQAGSSK